MTWASSFGHLPARTVGEQGEAWTILTRLMVHGPATSLVLTGSPARRHHIRVAQLRRDRLIERVRWEDKTGRAVWRITAAGIAYAATLPWNFAG